MPQERARRGLVCFKTTLAVWKFASVPRGMKAVFQNILRKMERAHVCLCFVPRWLRCWPWACRTNTRTLNVAAETEPTFEMVATAGIAKTQDELQCRLVQYRVQQHSRLHAPQEGIKPFLNGCNQAILLQGKNFFLSPWWA